MPISSAKRPHLIHQITDDGALELEHLRAKNAEQAAYLRSMREMQVDLTRYLVAQYQNPDRLIRIDGAADPANLHLHDQ